MQPDASGKYPYTGSLDCAVKTIKSGGPLKLYTGFPVYCVRIAPHVMVWYVTPPLILDDELPLMVKTREYMNLLI